MTSKAFEPHFAFARSCCPKKTCSLGVSNSVLETFLSCTWGAASGHCRQPQQEATVKKEIHSLFGLSRFLPCTPFLCLFSAGSAFCAPGVQRQQKSEKRQPFKGSQPSQGTKKKEVPTQSNPKQKAQAAEATGSCRWLVSVSLSGVGSGVKIQRPEKLFCTVVHLCRRSQCQQVIFLAGVAARDFRHRCCTHCQNCLGSPQPV